MQFDLILRPKPGNDWQSCLRCTDEEGLWLDNCYIIVLSSFALEPLLPKKLHTKSQDKLDRDEPERERKEKKKEKRNSKHQEIFDKEMKTTEIQLQPTEAVILSETVLYLFSSLLHPILTMVLVCFTLLNYSVFFSLLHSNTICCGCSWLKKRKIGKMLVARRTKKGWNWQLLWISMCFKLGALPQAASWCSFLLCVITDL